MVTRHPNGELHQKTTMSQNGGTRTVRIPELKRNLLVEPASIVERFATWARISGRQRFWGVAKTGGRFCLLLNTIGPDGYRVLMIVGVDNDDVYLVAGFPEDNEENDETKVGVLTDDPGHLLAVSLRWMLDLADEYQSLDMPDVAVLLAGVALTVAEKTGDVPSAAEALILSALGSNPLR